MNSNCNKDEQITIQSDNKEICEEVQTVKKTEIYQQQINFIVIETSNDELSYRNLLKFKCTLANRIKKTMT
ncbi:unnamed protein product [Paramecium pentaurelia]|uniref:Uncharacterized protein n=1 Tax=Paramecium pentaurelia TaxID=43138 RepID=A0A8S1XZY6_9CILI|nr:unnamed protein product [Paramecium pentaurelia]